MSSFKGECMSSIQKTMEAGQDPEEETKAINMTWPGLNNNGQERGGGGCGIVYATASQFYIAESIPSQGQQRVSSAALVAQPNRAEILGQLQHHIQGERVFREREREDAAAAATISIKEETSQLVKVEEQQDDLLDRFNHHHDGAPSGQQTASSCGAVAARQARNVAGRSRVSPPAQQPPHPPPEQQDKKMRREIANSNERRRMMCINNGFVSLQMILPKHYMKRGEKMSKAAVLQSTVDYISKLVMDNQKLQKKNQLLSDKFGPGIQDDDDCTEEGMPVSEHDSDQTVSSAKDLVSMVQHWREKYTRERCLRAQAIEEFRRLVSDPQYCCTQGCSKRQQYIAALHRRSKSPTPDNDDDFMGPVSQSEEQQQQHQMPVIVKRDISNQFPEATPCNERREAPIIVFRDPVPPPVLCESASAVPLKRKSSCSSALNYLSAPQPEPMMQEEAKMNKFSGFDILYQAIISSEGHVDGNRSDSGCSEETFDSNEPPKKRQKQQKNKQQPVVVVSTLSPPANMERVCS